MGRYYVSWTFYDPLRETKCARVLAWKPFLRLSRQIGLWTANPRPPVARVKKRRPLGWHLELKGNPSNQQKGPMAKHLATGTQPDMQPAVCKMRRAKWKIDRSPVQTNAAEQ